MEKQLKTQELSQKIFEAHQTVKKYNETNLKEKTDYWTRRLESTMRRLGGGGYLLAPDNRMMLSALEELKTFIQILPRTDIGFTEHGIVKADLEGDKLNEDTEVTELPFSEGEKRLSIMRKGLEELVKELDEFIS